MKLYEKILLIQQIFDDIAEAIKEKLNIEDWEEECIGPEKYASKIREIKTCNHTDEPPTEEPPIEEPPVEDPEITMNVTGEIKLDFNENLSNTITVTYKNCDVINDPQILSVARNVSWLRITDIEVNSAGDVYTYTIEADPNEGAERSAQIVFSCAKGENEISKTITVTQTGQQVEKRIVFTDGKAEKSIESGSGSIIIEVRYENCSSDEILDPVYSNVDWLDFSEQFEIPSDHPSVGTNNVLIQYIFYYNCDENIKEPRSCTIDFGIKDNGQLTKTFTVNHVPKTTISCTPSSLEFSSEGGSVDNIRVTVNNIKDGNDKVDVIERPEWLTVEIANETTTSTYTKKSVTVAAGKNEGGKREGNIVFKCQGWIGTKTVNVTVKQEEKPADSLSITVDPVQINVDENPYSKQIIVTTTDDDYNVTCNVNWITYEKNGNGVEINIEANESEESRKGDVIFTCINDPSISAKCTINQAAMIQVGPGSPPTSPSDSLPMYYGYIPYDSSITPSTWVSEGFNLITEEWILDGVTNGNITKVDTGVIGKTSWGITPKNSFVVIALPSSSGLVATEDNGIGGKVPFSVNPNANGDVYLTINSSPYVLYGQRDSLGYYNNAYFYIDKIK